MLYSFQNINETGRSLRKHHTTLLYLKHTVCAVCGEEALLGLQDIFRNPCSLMDRSGWYCRPPGKIPASSRHPRASCTLWKGSSFVNTYATEGSVAKTHKTEALTDMVHALVRPALPGNTWRLQGVWGHPGLHRETLTKIKQNRLTYWTKGMELSWTLPSPGPHFLVLFSIEEAVRETSDARC